MDKRKYYTLSVCDCGMCNSSADIIRKVLAKSCIYTGNDGIKEVNHAPKTEEYTDEIKEGDVVVHKLKDVPFKMVVTSIDENSYRCRWFNLGFRNGNFIKSEVIKQ